MSILYGDFSSEQIWENLCRVLAAHGGHIYIYIYKYIYIYMYIGMRPLLDKILKSKPVMILYSDLSSEQIFQKFQCRVLAAHGGQRRVYF